eukprot:7183214-Prymnesium_polylepis.1
MRLESCVGEQSARRPRSCRPAAAVAAWSSAPPATANTRAAPARRRGPAALGAVLCGSPPLAARVRVRVSFRSSHI